MTIETNGILDILTLDLPRITISKPVIRMLHLQVKEGRGTILDNHRWSSVGTCHNCNEYHNQWLDNEWIYRGTYLDNCGKTRNPRNKKLNDPNHHCQEQDLFLLHRDSPDHSRAQIRPICDLKRGEEILLCNSSPTWRWSMHFAIIFPIRTPWTYRWPSLFRSCWCRHRYH